LKFCFFQVKNSRSWAGNFYFVIGADSQIGYIWPFRKRDPEDWKIEMDRSICAIDKVNNLSPRPQFLVICGDLVDSMPNSQFWNFNVIFYLYIEIFIHISVNAKLHQSQVIAFQRIFSKLHPSISLVCVCGNHDVGNNPEKQTIDK